MNKIILFAFILISSPLLAQTWTSQANLPSGRHHPITFSLNGKGYAVTGTSSSNVPTSDFYDYDPVTNTWGTLPSFPGLSRSFGIGTVADSIAYIGFGATTTQYLNDMWSFDASDSSWTQLASCPGVGRRHPAMIAIGDKIYVGLGDGASGDLRDWWMYTISTNTWSQTANFLGVGRHHPFMFNAGGEVFAGLGHSGRNVYRDWYKLDTITNTWSIMSVFPGQARVAGTQFSANGYGYVLSGDGSNHSYMLTGEFWQYDPSLDSWTQLTAHPGRSKWAPGSFIINNEVYFFGGLDRLTNSFPLNTYKYTLPNPTGIDEEQEILSNTYIYPNPASNQISWKSDKRFTDVRIFNSVGQLSFSGTAVTGNVDVSNFANGLYFVQFYHNDNLVETSKVLIEN
jgi:N-acetylneuraminic acid mutarotase